MKKLFLILMMAPLGGCVTTTPNKNCTNYKPKFCIEGYRRCEINAEGCETCTCSKHSFDKRPPQTDSPNQ